MNKKLVAVAVAGVLAAPLAAQAQTANVTLYGRLNLDYEIVNGTTCAAAGNSTGGACLPNTTTNPTVSRLSANSSRVGLRGVESLGGGLSAIFQIESDVRGDTNNTNGWSSRETFVGLQGTWGTFKMGNFLMPMDDIHPIFGNVPTYTSSILSTASLWGQGPYSSQDGGFDARLRNSLRYDSPVWSGFNFSTQVSLRDSSGVTGGDAGDHTQEMRHAYAFGVGGYYNNGPIQGGIAYELHQKIRSYAVTPTTTFFANDWALTVAGGYNFGVIRPALVYQRLDYDTPSGSLTQNMWGVSATAPIGPGALYAFWGGASTSGGAAAGERVGGVTRGNDTNAQQYEVSYTYPLSKRTQVYAGYVKINNDKNAAYTFNINSYPINTTCINSDNAVNQNTCGSNGKPGGLVFGMIHLF